MMLFIIAVLVVALYMMFHYFWEKQYAMSLLFTLPVLVAASFIVFTPYFYDSVFQFIDNIDLGGFV